MNKIIEIFKRYYCFLTSVLMFLSFPSYDVFFLKAFPLFAWMAFVPLFMYVRDKDFRDVFLFSFFTGIAGNLFAFGWIGSFGAEVTYGPLVIIAFLIPYLTVFFTLKIITAEFLRRRFPGLGFLIYPSVWILVDWVQSIGHLAFPWPYIGHSQYPVTPLIQLVSVTGILGLNFYIILFNYILADGITKKNKEQAGVWALIKTAEGKRLIACVSLTAVITIAGMVSLTLNDKPVKKDLRLALVQSCISPWENWHENRITYLNELEKITTASLAADPDMIIWSESATLETIAYDYNNESPNIFESELLNFVKGTGRPLITGEIGVVEDHDGLFPNRYPTNSAVMINSYGEVIGNYAKIHLVPFGEWFPYDKWLPFVSNIVDAFGASHFIPGDEPDLFQYGGRKFSVLICYEGIFYRLCRKYKTMGADFFVNITNDGWTDSYGGHMQHFSASIFRAIENGVWYVRAGNTGFSAIIDPYGRVRASRPILEKGYVAGDLDFSFNRTTLYSRTGDLILYAAAIFFFVLVLIPLWSRLKRKIVRRET